MAEVGSIADTRVGTITVEGAEPLPSIVTAEVKLSKEVLPFEMEQFTRNGLETPLAARSLLWSSQNLGAVVRDHQDKLFHAIETTLPRIELGDKIKFAPSEPKESSRFEFVELVTVPKVSLQGLSQPASSSNPCFIDSNFNSGRPKTSDGLKLERKVQEAVREWDKWWTRYVGARKDPPAPPEEVSKPFREIIGNLLGIKPSEIAVLNKPDDLISDKISIDLFDKTIRGQGGATKADLAKRLERIGEGDLNVTLQLQAEAFREAEILGILGTAIHEAAHYRHYVLTKQLIAMWHSSSSRSQKSRPVTEQILRGKFGEFLDTLVRRKRLSNIERAIVYSTFDVIKATHPFAQLHAFMGVHPLYPREFDVAGSKKGRGMVSQLRFIPLLSGAQDWTFVTHPDVGPLSVHVIAEYAKHSDECVKADLRELSKEILALSNLKQWNPRAANYFKVLLSELGT